MKTMKKILLTTLDFWPKIGGVAHYYFNLCQHLEKDRIVALTQKNQEQVLPPAQSFKIYRKNLLSTWPVWPKWLPMIWHIWRTGRSEKIEMLWVGEILPTGAAVYLLTRFFRRPYSVFCHGMDILQAGKSRRKRWLARRILDKAEGVTVNSYYTKGLVERFGVPLDKIKII